MSGRRAMRVDRCWGARRAVRDSLSAVLSVVCVVACSGTSAGPSAPTLYPAGFAARTAGFDSRCALTTTSDWNASQAKLMWKLGGYTPTYEYCGFLTRSHTIPVSVNAAIQVPCSEVGNDPSPPPGTCNNGQYSPYNRVLFWNLVTNPSSNPTVSPPIQPDTQFTFPFTLAYQGATTFTALIPFQGVPFAPNSLGDYRYMAEVVFQRRAGTSTNAYARLTTSGQEESTNKWLNGPSMVPIGSSGTWRLFTSPAYDARLYQKRWTLDGLTIASGVNDSAVQLSAASPGPHALKLFMTTADGLTDSTGVNFLFQLNAGITGTGTVAAPGNYTWVAGSTGAASGITYTWQLYDQAAGTWNTLGSGSTASITASNEWPSGAFTMYLTVSAPGYGNNTATKSVANSITGGCGGFYCLRAPSRPSATLSRLSSRR